MDRRKHEIWAVLLLAWSILLLLSLISYQAADSTLFNSAPPSRHPRNWVGSVGANLSFVLLHILGIGAYILPLTGIWASWSLFWGTPAIPQHRWKLAGIVLCLFATTALFAIHKPRVLLWGQGILSGGLTGNWIASSLTSRLSSAGAHVILFCALLIAFLCMTSLSLKSMSGFLVQTLKEGAIHMMKGFSRGFQRQATSSMEPTQPSPPEASGASPVVDAASSEVKLLPPPARTLKKKQRKELDSTSGLSPDPPRYELPSLDMLDSLELSSYRPDWKKLEEDARVLGEKLADFGVQGKVTGIGPGPVITMFEYAPAPGIKISRIVNLSDDLSMALKALSIRVVAPIPGKAAIGVEIPNHRREMVGIRAVLESEAFSTSSSVLTIALGKDTTGQPVVANLARMPHLLIAGATGTGKSVCINSLLNSLLFRNTPDDLRLLLIDPKRIELNGYERIPHLIHPVVNDAKMATLALRWAVREMELRYRLLADKNVRNIESYNRALAKEKGKEPKPVEAMTDENPLLHHPLPYIVIIIDELADLMMIASREVEESITRLAQMARAAGIHLILATQRPSVDVLTGVIKANIPTRISFQVSSRIDSRTILDGSGAESLLGLGDMLFLPPGTAKLQRIHGAYISEIEVQRVTDFWREQLLVDDTMDGRVDFQEQDSSEDISEEELDEKFEEAVQLVLETRQASISMLQRRLRVGYNRAARMIEVMEIQGIVGSSDGVKPREVLGR